MLRSTAMRSSLITLLLVHCLFLTVQSRITLDAGGNAHLKAQFDRSEHESFAAQKKAKFFGKARQHYENKKSLFSSVPFGHDNSSEVRALIEKRLEENEQHDKNPTAGTDKSTDGVEANTDGHDENTDDAQSIDPAQLLALVQRNLKEKSILIQSMLGDQSIGALTGKLPLNPHDAQQMAEILAHDQPSPESIQHQVTQQSKNTDQYRRQAEQVPQTLVMVIDPVVKATDLSDKELGNDHKQSLADLPGTITEIAANFVRSTSGIIFNYESPMKDCRLGNDNYDDVDVFDERFRNIHVPREHANFIVDHPGIQSVALDHALLLDLTRPIIVALTSQDGTMPVAIVNEHMEAVASATNAQSSLGDAQSRVLEATFFASQFDPNTNSYDLEHEQFEQLHTLQMFLQPTVGELNLADAITSINNGALEATVTGHKNSAEQSTKGIDMPNDLPVRRPNTPLW